MARLKKAESRSPQANSTKIQAGNTAALWQQRFLSDPFGVLCRDRGVLPMAIAPERRLQFLYVIANAVKSFLLSRSVTYVGRWINNGFAERSAFKL